MDENLHKDNKERKYPIPQTLTNAISIIQSFKLMEKKGRALDEDYLKLDQVVGFSTVGMRSAWHDSLIWITGYVIVGAIVYFVQDTYLTETRTQFLIWQLDGSPLYWTSKTASFSGLVFSTGMCIYMASFYTGVACKKAVNSVIMTRALFLISLSLFIFVVLNGVNRFALTDAGIEETAYFFQFFSRDFSRRFFYFLHNYLKRALYEASIVTLIANIASVIVMFLSILVFRVAKRKEKVLGLERKA